MRLEIGFGLVIDWDCRWGGFCGQGHAEGRDAPHRVARRRTERGSHRTRDRRASSSSWAAGACRERPWGRSVARTWCRTDSRHRPWQTPTASPTRCRRRTSTPPCRRSPACCTCSPPRQGRRTSPARVVGLSTEEHAVWNKPREERRAVDAAPSQPARWRFAREGEGITSPHQRSFSPQKSSVSSGANVAASPPSRAGCSAWSPNT
jgi:hypothetical protein